MSVRPRPGEQVPPLTARVARASDPGGTSAMWVRDRLDGLWREEDFQAWYPRDGRPGLSPAQLATVSVLQFLYNLSDRQAAEAVRNVITDVETTEATGSDSHARLAVPLTGTLASTSRALRGVASSADPAGRGRVVKAGQLVVERRGIDCHYYRLSIQFRRTSPVLDARMP